MTDRDGIEPFVAAVGVTLRELTGIEATPREAGPNESNDLSAVIRMTCDGFVVLRFTLATATALAERMLDGAAPVDEEMVRDCMGELANVVAGQAKALLRGTADHFAFSTPVVGADPPGLPIDRWREVAFDSPVGEFLLRVRRPGW